MSQKTSSIHEVASFVVKIKWRYIEMSIVAKVRICYVNINRIRSFIYLLAQWCFLTAIRNWTTRYLYDQTGLKPYLVDQSQHIKFHLNKTFCWPWRQRPPDPVPKGIRFGISACNYWDKEKGNIEFRISCLWRGHGNIWYVRMPGKHSSDGLWAGYIRGLCPTSQTINAK